MPDNERKGNVPTAVLNLGACGEVGTFIKNYHEGECDILAGPGFGPLYQEITGGDVPAEDKRRTKDLQLSDRPLATTDIKCLGEPQTEEQLVEGNEIAEEHADIHLFHLSRLRP